MKVLANPKTLFKRGSWIKRAYYRVRSWFRYTFNKEHLMLVKEAINGRPWDQSFLFDLEYKKIKEMMEYHKKVRRFNGVENVIRDMGVCLSLIEIFTGKRQLFHYTGKLMFVPADEKYNEGTNEEGLMEIKESPDFKYHCDVKVNLKNISRFVSNEKIQKWYIKSPHELYELKARYLYHKIRYYREEEWWD